MNPAIKIWARSLLLCALCCICASVWRLDGEMVLIAFLVVVLASLASLLGFYILFEWLSDARLSETGCWLATLILIPAIVAVNSGLLIAALHGIDLGRYIGLSSSSLMTITAAPMTAAMLAAGSCRRQINAYAAA